jgi:hypothetical protein
MELIYLNAWFAGAHWELVRAKGAVEIQKCGYFKVPPRNAQVLISRARAFAMSIALCR